MLASSRAGHDAGRVYVITERDDAYVYLSDGRISDGGQPQEKEKKHVQLICTHDWPARTTRRCRQILRKMEAGKG